jgi:F-type H+-transporting ATPase subunit b
MSAAGDLIEGDPMFFVTTANAEEAKTDTAVEGHTPAAGETVHTETGVAHEGEHGGVFPPFDPSTFASQLLWLAITFGLFYILLSRVITPRIGNILETRDARIKNDLAEAAKLKDEADAAVAAYEQELASARANATKIGNEARDASKAEADVERRSAEAGLEKKLADADKRISAVRATGMASVGKIAEETASAILEKLTSGKFTPAQISAAIKAVKG